MDNESNNSEDEFSVYTSQNAKPNNRHVFNYKGLCVRSDFPGGNLQDAMFQQQFRLQAKPALLVQFWGNSDAQSDPTDKSWFYFSVSGMRDSRVSKYQQIIFKFKNANNYRKFVKQKKFRPYIVYRQQKEKVHSQWKTLFISKMNILQDQSLIQAQFVYKLQSGIDRASFALNIPYNLSNLESLNHRILDSINSDSYMSKTYYHRQIIAQSIDEIPIYMITITSINNILSYDQKQEVLWPYKGIRPFQLKSKPEIVFTSRVHPSQTSSSYCAQGIIEALINNPNFQLLKDLFIFRIVPMMNPDGVENGHYRLDNYLQNLNRFYGHSNPTKTPSVHAVQKLITNLRQRSKLFLFMDIHGHNSPKHSFMFGNFSQNFYLALQNRTFVKIIQALSQGNFSYAQCQFSKKNMSVKQKYDEHSKEASARVFAYQGNSESVSNSNQGQNQAKVESIVEHSYTLQLNPYIISNNSKSMLLKLQNSYRNLPQNYSPSMKRSQNMVCIVEPDQQQIIGQYKQIGENVLVAVLQLIGANMGVSNAHIGSTGSNTNGKYSDGQSGSHQRKRALRQISKFPQFYDKQKRSKQKQINREVYQRYYTKWNFLQSYKQYLLTLTNDNNNSLPPQQLHTSNCNSTRANNSEIRVQSHKARIKSCPLVQLYEELYLKKNIKRNKNNSNIAGLNINIKTEDSKRKNDEQKTQRQAGMNNESDGNTFRDEGDIKNNELSNINMNIVYEEVEKQRFQRLRETYRKSVNNPQKKQKQAYVKSMELQMLQKIQMQNLKQKNNKLLNAYSLKSCTPSLSPQKARIKGQDPNQLQRKIKKLIFRHRTQMQKQPYGSNSNMRGKDNRKKDKIPNLIEVQYTEMDGQLIRNQKLKELQQQYLGYVSSNNNLNLNNNVSSFNYNMYYNASSHRKNKSKLSNLINIYCNGNANPSVSNSKLNACNDANKVVTANNSKNCELQKKFSLEKVGILNSSQTETGESVKNEQYNDRHASINRSSSNIPQICASINSPDVNSKARLKIIEKFNPKIQELVRRISIKDDQKTNGKTKNKNIQQNSNKNNYKSIEVNGCNSHMVESNRAQMNRIKSTKMISNLILTKSKKKHLNISEKQKQVQIKTKNYNTINQQPVDKREGSAFHSKDNTSNTNNISNDSNLTKSFSKRDNKSILIPLLHQSRINHKLDKLTTPNINKYENCGELDRIEIPQCFKTSNTNISCPDDQLQSQFAIKNKYYESCSPQNYNSSKGHNSKTIKIVMEHMANIQNNIRARDKHDVTSKSGDKHSQTNHSEDKHIFSDANIEAKLDTAKLQKSISRKKYSQKLKQDPTQKSPIENPLHL